MFVFNSHIYINKILSLEIQISSRENKFTYLYNLIFKFSGSLIVLKKSNSVVIFYPVLNTKYPIPNTQYSLPITQFSLHNTYLTIIIFFVSV